MIINRIILFCLLTLVGAKALSIQSPVRSEDLSFQWQANDGAFFHKCTHVLVEKELMDWRVECGGRTFTVHFFLKQITRDIAPQKTIEVLYYITGRENSSQGVWLHLSKDSPMHSLVFHQSVDNDSSDLVLTYRAPAP